MAILNVGGIATAALKKSGYNIDKTAARLFTEYYKAGILDFEAAKGEGDKIEISTVGNVGSKMAKLEDKFADVDFSKMSNTEAFQMVEKAYNREFPEFRTYERLNPEMFSKVTEQRDNLLKRALNIKPGEDFQKKVVEVYKKANGYEGMSDSEIAQSIKEHFEDEGTHFSRTKILNERVYTGLMSGEERDAVIKDIQYNLERKFCQHMGIHRIEDFTGTDRERMTQLYGEWKFKFYEGGFDKPDAELPPLDELWKKMVVALGEYIIEVQPLIDDVQEGTKETGKTETPEAPEAEESTKPPIESKESKSVDNQDSVGDKKNALTEVAKKMTAVGGRESNEEQIRKNPDIDPEKRKGKERDVLLQVEKFKGKSI